MSKKPLQPSKAQDVWIPSRYNVSSSLGEKEMVISNLFSGIVETVPIEVWKKYLRPGSSYRAPWDNIQLSLQILFDQGFLVSNKIDELERVKVYFQQIRYDINGMRVLIAPTMACIFDALIASKEV